MQRAGRRIGQSCQPHRPAGRCICNTLCVLLRLFCALVTFLCVSVAPPSLYVLSTSATSGQRWSIVTRRNGCPGTWRVILSHASSASSTCSLSTPIAFVWEMITAMLNLCAQRVTRSTASGHGQQPELAIASVE